MTFSLEQVEAHLRDRVAPQAEIIDRSVEALQQAFQALGQQEWLGLKVPTQWGGSGVSPVQFQQFQELLAQYSGALAFLQAQHQSAGAFLSRSNNESLKQEYLPHLKTGDVGIGVGFSHLRRQDNPPLKALPVEGGFQLNGFIPWITGYGLFEWFIGAAILPDDRAVYGLIPFHNAQQPQGTLRFSELMELAAMTSTNTVTAEVYQWFLAESHVLFTTPAKAIHTSDMQNVLQHSFYALGCAQAGLNIVKKAANQRSLPFIHETYAALQQKLQTCRTEIYQAGDRSFTDRLSLRAWAIELAVRCAHAAVTVSAGAANSLAHPAQRIYREALVFTVTGQTPQVMEATLQRLTRSSTR